MILLIKHSLNLFIVKLIICKLIFDLCLHAYSLVLYQRWLGTPKSERLWLKSIGATLTEPFAFQILRQLGAAFGWFAFLRRKIDWMPQRPAAEVVIGGSRGERPRIEARGRRKPAV